MANVPTIVGAGNPPGKKTRPKSGPRKPKPGKPKPDRPRKPLPRQPKPMQPMPYYPSTGSNERPGAMPKERLKDALVKVWNDRNSNNDGTKLNR